MVGEFPELFGENVLLLCPPYGTTHRKSDNYSVPVISLRHVTVLIAVTRFGYELSLTDGAPKLTEVPNIVRTTFSYGRIVRLMTVSPVGCLDYGIFHRV